jgi:hypothetical protein
MLYLKENQKCPHANNCPYNNTNKSNLFCKGADENRLTPFTCNLVNNGVFAEGKIRSGFDETGKMGIILE